jgi:hypothetical protein
MCDYSLQSVKSRPAAVGDKLVITNFGTGTKGFGAIGDPLVAVCLLPGTEIAFDRQVFQCGGIDPLGELATFRQINKEHINTHHDALEFSSGVFLLTYLAEGQHATVLQLPAAPKTEAEAQEQKRVEYAG